MCQHTPQEFLHNLWCDLVHGTDMNADFESNIRPIFFPYLRLMVNRLRFGHYRYGTLGRKDKPLDRVSDMHERLDLYEQTGNLEHLVDVSNMAFCEYVEGDHPNKHFSATDDSKHSKRRK